MSAYQTAVLKPPHLAAIMPWEGISDIYREVNTTGGIPNVAFQQLWMNLTGNGLGRSEDHSVAALEHPLYDDLWKSKVVDWSKIDIPAFSVTGWSSLGLHLRGTIEAWRHFSSKQKYLQVHVRATNIILTNVTRVVGNGASFIRTQIKRNSVPSGTAFSRIYLMRSINGQLFSMTFELPQKRESV
jgi:predicted acyl esterase